MNPFPRWLAEMAADGVVVRPDDINAEARGNLWTFSLSPEQAAAVTPSDVEEFVRAVAGTRSRWLATNGDGHMLLYCWHDAQAGQLRLSLVSVTHGRLPFGCPVEPVEELSAVVWPFLGSTAMLPSSALPVWAIELP